MKIKKKTSLMMIAASTAAVVGVAAVSFAAWQGGTQTLTASAATGHVNLTGFTSTVDELEALVPVDQGAGNTVNSFEVTYLATEVSTLKASYEITTESNAVAELELWVKVGEQVTTVAAADVTEENGWHKLEQTDIILNSEVAASNEEVSTYVSMVLVSSASTDMDQSFTVTLTLTANE